jgi:hypothetical protein
MLGITVRYQKLLVLSVITLLQSLKSPSAESLFFISLSKAVAIVCPGGCSVSVQLHFCAEGTIKDAVYSYKWKQ